MGALVLWYNGVTLVGDAESSFAVASIPGQVYTATITAASLPATVTNVVGWFAGSSASTPVTTVVQVLTALLDVNGTAVNANQNFASGISPWTAHQSATITWVPPPALGNTAGLASGIGATAPKPVVVSAAAAFA